MIILGETPKTKLTLQLRTPLSLPSIGKSHLWALPARFSLFSLVSASYRPSHTHAWMHARWRGEAYLDVMSLWTLPLKLNHNCVMSDTALYMTQMKSSIFPWIESSISSGDKTRLQYLIICLLRSPAGWSDGAFEYCYNKHDNRSLPLRLKGLHYGACLWGELSFSLCVKHEAV